jgi:hypothetical protein
MGAINFNLVNCIIYINPPKMVQKISIFRGFFNIAYRAQKNERPFVFETAKWFNKFRKEWRRRY